MALGNFDGVHKGHQQLIGKAVRAAKRHGLKSAVFTFSNHPKSMLGDGREVKIEKEQTVSLSADGAAVNYKDGCLVYDSPDPAAERLDCRKVESRNQFVIPSGGENTIVLSDGTRVKLNAESKLIYPTRFLNRQRTVFLEGEAFFDVTPDKTRPFVVQTRLGDVKVKKFLNAILEELLAPIRARRKEAEQDIPEVYDILKRGSMQAREVAAQTLSEVRRAMKIDYFNDAELIREQSRRFGQE